MSTARRSIASTFVLAAFASLGASGSLALADEPIAQPAWSMVAIDRAASLPMSEGDELVMNGSLVSSFDGTTIEAVTHLDPPGARTDAPARALFDLDGSGLMLASWDPVSHEARLKVSGPYAPVCDARGVAAPCLVPRLDALAHDRLLSRDEFASTLRGAIQMKIERLPEPPIFPRFVRAALPIAVAAFAIFLGAVALAFRSTRRRSAIGQVGIAAAEARIATRGDAMLAPVAAQIAELVRRARDLEASRRACAAKLTKMDRAALAKKRAGWAASNAPEAAELLAWITAEEAEASRLEADHGASIVGLERIASALRVITLRARSHRGARIRVAGSPAIDPVDTVASELALRDEAIAEAERIA